MNDINDYSGVYGRYWDSHGVIADRVGIILEKGGLVSSTGRFIGFPGGRALRIVCGEMVEVYSEDGPAVGRCGIPVDHADDHACRGHAAERDEWLAMSEYEKMVWEHEHDAYQVP